MFSTIPNLSNTDNVYEVILNAVKFTEKGMTEMQLIEMFEVLCTNYSEDSLLEIQSRSVEHDGTHALFSQLSSEFTLINEAMKNGWFRLVIFVMVGRLNFDVIFYRVNNRLTLLHVAAKHCLIKWNKQYK